MIKLIISFAVIIIILIWLYYKHKNTSQVNRKEEFRMFDRIRGPLHIGVLMQKEVKIEHLIGTLLKFIDKKYVKVTPIYKDNKVVSYEFEKKKLNFYSPIPYHKLVDKERCLYEADCKELSRYGVSISEIYVINRIIFNDREKVNIKNVEEFYDNKNCEGNELDELYSKRIFVEKIINEEFKLYGLTNKNGSLTKYGNEKTKEWEAFKQKIKNESYIGERTLEGLKVWGENLAIGVALSICKVSIKEINDLYNKPKFLSRDYVENNNGIFKIW